MMNWQDEFIALTPRLELEDEWHHLKVDVLSAKCIADRLMAQQSVERLSAMADLESVEKSLGYLHKVMVLMYEVKKTLVRETPETWLFETQRN